MYGITQPTDFPDYRPNQIDESVNWHNGTHFTITGNVTFNNDSDYTESPKSAPAILEVQGSTFNYSGLVEVVNSSNALLRAAPSQTHWTGGPSTLRFDATQGAEGKSASDFFTEDYSATHSNRKVIIGCSVFAALSVVIIISTVLYLRYGKGR